MHCSSWPMPAFEVQQVGNPPRFRVQASVTVDGVEGKVAGQEAPSLVVPIYCLWRQGWTTPGAG